MATEKAQTLSTLRTKVLSESLHNEGRNRFGLFSYPPAGVTGTGEYDFTKSKKLNADGKVKTEARGLYSGPSSSGKVESSYFAKTAYITIGDKYVDPASRDRQYELEKKKKITHDSQFKPANGTKSDPIAASYEHKTELHDVKKDYRGADGKVAVAPKNITTNPAKVGHGDSTIGHLFSKTTPHMTEPYERARELAAKEREEHKKKLQEQPFRSVSHGNRAFIKDKDTFGKDANVLDAPKPRAKSPEGKTHEAPFKPSNPSKQGYNKTINKFPEYKSDPIRVAVRKFEDPANKKDAFKPNNTAFCDRPTPSISLNKQNLKSDMMRMC